MYRCDGCGRNVAATSQDPIHWPGGGKYCTGCLGKVHKTVETPSTSRADAARARWAAKSDEEKRAHVARMQAGRSLR